MLLLRARVARRMRIGAKNSTPARIRKHFFMLMRAENGFFSSVCALSAAGRDWREGACGRKTRMNCGCA
jgi:hypothetical protein